MYDHSQIEEKWQKIWAEEKHFEAVDFAEKPKYYALVMFPYPSGYGLHVGHLASYTPAEALARYKRAKGYNVLMPFGYDAFGLPAEQFAIQTGRHPEDITRESIGNFRRQIQSFGFSFDWSRELATCDESYYKWTQYIFTKLYERGLAYQKEVPVNWCPALKTVLANDEIVDGKSERGGHPVMKVPMKQWVLKITEYADRLLNDLNDIQWPERTKEGQRNWIGKSTGARVRFPVKGSSTSLEVFTTRPDTLFGVTFMVVAPEHPAVRELVSDEQRSAVEAYIQKAAGKSDIDRQASTEKTGVFSGGYVTHPITGKDVPVWVADYVLMDYGTGAIMAVPGHDERDYEFAQTFDIEVLRVLESDEDLPFIGDGTLVNSDFLNGLSKPQAIAKMTEHLVQNGLGEEETQFRLRDWIFSRQRYWGEPFPMIHYPDGTVAALPVSELPVSLPEVPNYEPTEKGDPPLAKAEEWVNYTDAKGQSAKRDTDTMPGAAGSSWYFLRYIDPHNEQELCTFEKQKYWMPVDFYLGGPEHTVGHLLYSRFWHKVLFDAGSVSHHEPFQQLAHQGMILGEDGEKMSKSRGNTVNPDDLRISHGADAARTYILFLGPMDRDKPWATNGIEGVKRFLDRVWRLAVDDQGQIIADDQQPTEEVEKAFHKTIKKVGEDIESLNFNTAISQMMILTNEMYKAKCHSRSVIMGLCQLLQPFAPHMAEELWEKLGGDGRVCTAPWPSYDENKIVDETVTMGVQVNGKMRGKIEISPEADEDTAVGAAKQLDSVKNALQDKEVAKIIYRPGRILNLIAK